MEAYRKLHKRYAKTKMQEAIARLINIVNTRLGGEANFETAFANWENEVLKFELALGRPVYDDMKVGLLIAGKSGKLHDHLCLTVPNVIDYDQIKKTPSSTTSRRSHWDGTGSQTIQTHAQ